MKVNFRHESHLSLWEGTTRSDAWNGPLRLRRRAARDFADVIRDRKSEAAKGHEGAARNLADAEHACAQVLEFLEREFP